MTKDELTYDDLRAIGFALQFTYWLHRAQKFAPANLEVLRGKIFRLAERAQVEELYAELTEGK